MCGCADARCWRLLHRLAVGCCCCNRVRICSHFKSASVASFLEWGLRIGALYLFSFVGNHLRFIFGSSVRLMFLMLSAPTKNVGFPWVCAMASSSSQEFVPFVGQGYRLFPAAQHKTQCNMQHLKCTSTPSATQYCNTKAST